MLEYDGEVKCLMDWSETLGFDYHTIKARINKLGWSVKDAFEKPVKIQKHKRK